VHHTRARTARPEEGAARVRGAAVRSDHDHAVIAHSIPGSKRAHARSAQSCALCARMRAPRRQGLLNQAKTSLARSFTSLARPFTAAVSKLLDWTPRDLAETLPRQSVRLSGRRRSVDELSGLDWVVCVLWPFFQEEVREAIVLVPHSAQAKGPCMPAGSACVSACVIIH